MDKSRKALFLLILITFIWGYSFVFSSTIINDGITSEVLMFARFGVGAIALAIIGFSQIKNSNKTEIKAGIIAGLCIVFAIYMQNESFNHTTISKSSFISGSSIILVPFLALVFNNSSVTFKNVIGLVLALGGTIVLSVDATTFSSINFGDFIALLSAFGFAFQIVMLAKYGKGTRVINVAFFQTFTVTIGGLTIAVFNGSPIAQVFTTDNLIPLIYLGVFATSICYIVQAYAAKYVKEVVLSVIISSQAIVASFLDVIIFNNAITSQLLIGATLISAAILYLSLDKDNKKNLQE